LAGVAAPIDTVEIAMTHDAAAMPRRRLLRAGAILAAAPLVFAAERARASAKTPKTDVSYQYSPHGGQHCGICASFVPGADPKGAGTCRVVDGEIPQGGWCILFSKP
jgi:hypothetical protein